MLETGFGTGLNFLVTWAAWRDDPQRPARLHFLSVEKHPFRADDLAHLHAQWPEFATLSSELLANWPVLTPGFHRIALDGGRVQLTLMLGDALDCLPQVQAGVDAFYLDGFAPDCNADLWRPSAVSMRWHGWPSPAQWRRPTRWQRRCAKVWQAPASSATSAPATAASGIA